MTTESIALMELIEKHGDTDVLKELGQWTLQRLMELELVGTPQKIGSFDFNLRELAGSFGDFGTLFPLAIGYIAVCGLDPAGFLVMMGF